MSTAVANGSSDLVNPEQDDDDQTEGDIASRAVALVRARYDLLAVVAISAAAYLARRGTLPGDGLWFDDSWVATGAIIGTPSELMTVGSGHPGFTALLMAVHRLGTGSTWSLGLPALVAGVLGPPLLYVALRSARFGRAVSTLVAAALVIAPIHALYSGRVKGYTLDTVLVLLLVLVLPLVIRRRWTWPIALAWTGTMLVAGTFSGYLLVASAAATGIVVLHPKRDLVRRLSAAALQGLVQLAYLLEAKTRTDLAGIEQVLEDQYDGHLTVSLDPRTMAPEVLKHLRRVAEVFPGGSGRWLSVAALTALAGLSLSVVRGRSPQERLVARFLLLAFGLAFVGGLVDQFPFGPHNDSIVVLSPGGRHTLWLLPAFAFGLARAATEVHRIIARTDAARLTVNALLLAASVGLVATGMERAPAAPGQGSASATRYVDTHRRAEDLLIVSGGATFSFANDTALTVDLVPTPDHQVGYAPVYDDPNVVAFGSVWATQPLSIGDLLERADRHDRVYLISAGAMDRNSLVLGPAFEEAGWGPAAVQTFEWSRVDTWERNPDR